MVWFHPDWAARVPATLDTVLFDVDGVLIDTSRSYRLAVIHAVDHLVRAVHGLRDAPTPLLTPEDVAAFKLAGGFNNDWHATQMLAALWTARLREWRGMPEAALSLGEWAARATVAAREQRGGVAWTHATFPATAIPSMDVARWAEDEFYWGAALIREHYGRVAAYAPDAAGFVHNEELLLPDDLFGTLAAHGSSRLGLVTGRVGPEVRWAVRRLIAGSGLPPSRAGAPSEPLFAVPAASRSMYPFAAVVTGDDFAKPDPTALAHAARSAGARGGIYIGDTADDLDLVLRYRAELLPANPSLPPFLAVVIASGRAEEEYAARGADAVVAHVRELPAVLAHVRAHQADVGTRVRE
jgi:phosphoglycolate phosphatase-like HAD superfamily hydrolase